MFTGIIQSIGKVSQVERKEADCSIYFDCADLATQVINLGDSIALNGCCLTVVERNNRLLKVDVSAETLARTTLGELQPDSLLNLELAMLADTRFGGHIVSGHVDCQASVNNIAADGRSIKFDFSVTEYGRFIAEKGSVTIDGVSLTVNSVIDASNATEFSVNIIPHTLEATTFDGYALGSKVNVEVDMIARYVERLHQFNLTG